MDDELLKISEVARYCKMSDSAVRHWIKLGVLPAVVVGLRSIRIRQSDIASIIRPKQPAQPIYFRNAPEAVC